MSEQPDLSDMPPINCFEVSDDYRSAHPMAQMMDAITPDPGYRTYARVDLQLPLGCPFSLFLVRGYIKDAEMPCMEGTLVVSRALAQELAAVLDDSDILEFTVEPRTYSDLEHAP